MKLPLLALDTAILVPDFEETEPQFFDRDLIANENNHADIFSSFREQFLRNIFLPPLECFSRRNYVNSFLKDIEVSDMVDWETQTRSSRGVQDDFLYEYKYTVQPSLTNSLNSPFVNLTTIEDRNQILDSYIFLSNEQFQIKYLRSILSQHLFDKDGNTQPEISSDVIGSELTSLATSYRVRDILTMFFQIDLIERSNFTIFSFEKLATEKMLLAVYGDHFRDNKDIRKALIKRDTQQSLLDALDFFGITTITTVLVLYHLIVLCDAALLNLYDRPGTGPGFLRYARRFSENTKRARTDGSGEAGPSSA